MSAPAEEQLFTPEEVAQKLKVRPSTVLTWLQKGKLRGVKLGGPGGVWRIRERDLRAFIEAGIGPAK